MDIAEHQWGVKTHTPLPKTKLKNKHHPTPHPPQTHTHTHKERIITSGSFYHQLMTGLGDGGWVKVKAVNSNKVITAGPSRETNSADLLLAPRSNYNCHGFVYM